MSFPSFPWLEGTPLLPEVMPRDLIHEAIVQAVVEGKYRTQEELAPLFEVPGIGFHRSLYYLTTSLAHFRLSGRQVFALPPTMQDMLAETSLEGVKFSEVKFPYSCFYVALPKSNLRLWGGERTGWHTLAGAMVQVAANDALNVYLWAAANEKSESAGDDAAFWLCMRYGNEHDIETNLRKVLSDPHSEQPIEADLTPLGMQLDLAFSPLAVPVGTRTELHEDVVKAIRIVVNAMVYLDSTGAEQERDPSCSEGERERAELEKALARIKNPNKKQARHLRKQLDSLPKSNLVWLGRSVGRTLPTRENMDEGGGERRHHWVRGHWWPKRDPSYEKQTSEARDRTVKAQWEHDEVRIRLAALPPTDTEGLARETLTLMGAKKTLKVCKEEADLLAAVKTHKRRWVQPYERNVGAEASVTHTYVLSEPGAQS